MWVRLSVLCYGNDQANQDKQRNDSNEGQDGEPLKPTRHRCIFELHHWHSPTMLGRTAFRAWPIAPICPQALFKGVVEVENHTACQINVEDRDAVPRLGDNPMMISLLGWTAAGSFRSNDGAVPTQLDQGTKDLPGPFAPIQS
jgi:hypothetical protein